MKEAKIFSASNWTFVYRIPNRKWGLDTRVVSLAGTSQVQMSSLVRGILTLILSSSEWMLKAISGLNHRPACCLTKSTPNNTMRVRVNRVYWEEGLDPSSIFFAISTTFPTASHHLSCSFSRDKQTTFPGILRCLLHTYCLHWVLLGDFAPFVHSFSPPVIHVSKYFEFYIMQGGSTQRWQRWLRYHPCCHQNLQSIVWDQTCIK